MRKVFITGTAGFIGFHLAQLLLDEGFRVHGFDGMTDYYDVKLKQRRHQMLLQNPHFSMTEGMLEDDALITQVTDDFAPDVIVHLAGQAGVRYSLENPRAYLDSNLVGTFNVMEAARRLKVGHLLMASTSSVYGANRKLPFAVGEPFNRTEFAATYFVVNGLDARLEVDAELAEIRASDDPYGERRDTYLTRREREIAALKGETIPEPEAEDDFLDDDDLPPQSELTLPERLQLTASDAPGGR